jgi:MSHA biogenesis protein MshN
MSAIPTDAPAAASPPETGKGLPKTRPAMVAVAVDKAPAAAGGKGEIEKRERQPTPRELADHEYRKAAGALQQGRFAEAQEGFRAALSLNATHHAARQSLVALLVEAKAMPEAERTLQEGLKLAPDQSAFTMTLARLQLNRGDSPGAIAALQGGLPYAQGNAEYAAFLAALLQRQGRHEEAIEQFQAALRTKPNTGVWWLGMGMSLQAAHRAPEAQESYRRAKASPLSPDLSAFADQRLRQLQ